MTLNVIGAGVGRTGTYSLKLAINQIRLGPCHHMEEVLRPSLTGRISMTDTGVPWIGLPHAFFANW
jgi:hypothetical protein